MKPILPIKITTLGTVVLFLAVPATAALRFQAQPSQQGSLVIADPSDPIRNLEIVENFSEEVADRLLVLGEDFVRREFTKIATAFAADFSGHGLSGLAEKERVVLPLGAQKTVFDVKSAVTLNHGEFLADMRELTGRWSRVELALWKVKGAEFQAGATPLWGKLRLYLNFIGDLPSGGREEWSAWAYAHVERRKGAWQIVRLVLESADSSHIEKTIFPEISAAAGVAHLGVRYGKPGNTEDAWNGAAAGDVNADGLWDLFLPGLPNNFLYLRRKDGSFESCAAKHGLQGPGGGTGTVFFDYDNDGDQDLFVAHRAWRESGAWRGETLRLYQNDGTGKFSDVSAEVGLAVHRVAFSVTAFDYDLDGFVDLFVCGYGRAASERNDSWVQAKNGAPNSLFRNLGGKKFEDVAPRLGLAGTSWTYASSAADYDADGDLDLHIANDYGFKELWQNDGSGGFKNVAAELGLEDLGNGMGTTWGDLNGDGRLDVYVSNMSSTAGSRILGRLASSLDPETYSNLKKLAAGNSIFLATADGGFVRQPASAGGINGSWAWSAALADLDLDGALDVYCASGFVTGDFAADT